MKAIFTLLAAILVSTIPWSAASAQYPAQYPGYGMWRGRWAADPSSVIWAGRRDFKRSGRRLPEGNTGQRQVRQRLVVIARQNALSPENGRNHG